jgi:hypothetical protein
MPQGWLTPREPFTLSASQSELGFPARSGRFLFRRIDHLTGLVSSRSSGHTSNGSPSDRADGTTQGRTDNCAGSRTAGGSHSGTNRMSPRLSRRLDRFTDLVSSRSSGHTSNGGPHGCADGTTQGRASNCAASRPASRSHSGTDRMRTRLSRGFNSLVNHDEPPSFYDHCQSTSTLQLAEDTVPALSKNAVRFDVDSMYGRFDAVQ